MDLGSLHLCFCNHMSIGVLMDCTTTCFCHICYNANFTFLLRTSSKFHFLRSVSVVSFSMLLPLSPAQDRSRCVTEKLLHNLKKVSRQLCQLCWATQYHLSIYPEKQKTFFFFNYIFFPHVGESFLQFQSYSASTFKISIVLIHSETISVQFS